MKILIGLAGAVLLQVYLILMIQLTFTVSMICLFLFW